MRKFVVSFAVLAAVVMLSASASAATLASWEIEQAGSLGAAPVTTVAADISSTDLAMAPTPTRLHPGIGWPDAVGTFAENWRLSGSLEFAIQENDYYGFTISPDAGSTIDFSNLYARFSVNDGGGSADVSFHLLSSQTGFTYEPLWGNVLDTLNVTAAGNGYNPVLFQHNVDLSAVAALQSVATPTEFRIYFTSVEGNRMGIGQAWGLPADEDLRVDGTVTAIPEPSSLALLGIALLGAVLVRRK